MSPHLYLPALIIISSTYITRRITGTRGIARAFPVLAAGTALFFMLANPVVAELDTRPVKDLAVVLKTHLRPGDEVMSYKVYYQDLPVYLERHVTVVDWYGELAFGATVEDTSAWMIEEAEFQKRWRGPNSIYLLTDLKTYDVLRNEKRLTFYPIARNRRTILLSNKEVIS